MGQRIQMSAAVFVSTGGNPKCLLGNISQGDNTVIRLFKDAFECGSEVS
jgi:hypothetical protein